MYSEPEYGKGNLLILSIQQAEQKIKSFLLMMEGLHLETTDLITFSKRWSNLHCQRLYAETKEDIGVDFE